METVVREFGGTSQVTPTLNQRCVGCGISRSKAETLLAGRSKLKPKQMPGTSGNSVSVGAGPVVKEGPGSGEGEDAAAESVL